MSDAKKADNIDKCVQAAKRLSEKKKKLITYGIYMALYHDSKSNRRRKAKK